MGKLFDAAAKGSEAAIEADGRWLICESAIVAENEDPERQGRIKVVIPSLDEDYVFDDWVMSASGVCLGDKLGSVFIPPKGTEVLISGVLGQKYNLIYHAPVYNEECSIPDELGVDTAGMKVPKNLSFIAGMVAKIMGDEIRHIAQTLVRLEAASIQSVASGENKVQGATVTINSNGSMTIHASGNIAVTADGNLTLQNRVVNKVGPAI